MPTVPDRRSRRPVRRPARGPVGRALRAAAVGLLAACARPAASGAPSAAATVAAEPGAPDTAAVVAFVGAHLIPMTAGGGRLDGHTVVVRGDRIVAVGPARAVRVPDGALVVDAAGLYLMPGLADMHVHLEYGEDPAVLALFLANGVTTVRSMDGRPHVLAWRRRVASGDLPGPAIYTAGPILDGDPPSRDDNLRLRTADEARREVLRQQAAGYDFVKVYTTLGAAAFGGVMDAAREAGLPVAGHVPRAVGLRPALAAGLRSVEHLADYAGPVEAADSPFRGRFHWSKLFLAMPLDSARAADVAGTVARAGAWSVPTLVERDRALAPPATVRGWMEAAETAHVPAAWRDAWAAQLGGAVRRMDDDDWRLVARGAEQRRQMVRALRRAGVGLLVGTDTPNAFVVPGFSVHDELAAFVAAGVPPEAALAAATRDAARFAGAAGEWGTVQPGARADLVLLRADPLADVRATRDPAGVMARGRWYPAARLAALLRDARH